MVHPESADFQVLVVSPDLAAFRVFQALAVILEFLDLAEYQVLAATPASLVSAEFLDFLAIPELAGSQGSAVSLVIAGSLATLVSHLQRLLSQPRQPQPHTSRWLQARPEARRCIPTLI